MDKEQIAVKTGLDLLVETSFEAVRGERVGLLAHPASVDRDLTHLLDLARSHDVQLVRLFGPEHGLLGDAQDMAEVSSHKDERTGLEVVSLYGDDHNSLMLDPAHLNGIDTLICDLQDVGSRYYTFCYTIAFAHRACVKAGTRCLVLDRPNPINARAVEGNVVKPEYVSFVGEYPLANRHGMTLGELCRFFAAKDGLAAPEVMWMAGYQRDMHFADTGLPWVLPSPNMPTVDTALVYPGGCLFEGTNLSEGRGTTRPFELVGGPFIDDAHGFADALNAHGLPGIRFRPTFFRPTFQKHAGKLCGGVQLHIEDEKALRPLKTGVAVIAEAMRFDGFDWRREPYEFVSDRLAMDLLFGDDAPRLALEKGASVDSVMGILDEGRGTYSAERQDALHPAYG
jgi:uncharacterized protein YbbC (DUF1343 family)